MAAHPTPYPDRAPHGAQVMVVRLHHQHVRRVRLPVQGPGPSHQEPTAHMDPEVVAMVTCGQADEGVLGTFLKPTLGMESFHASCCPGWGW